jgi:group II intron reverse transcriptase/maturase
VELELKDAAQFNWFHGPALSSLLCRVFNRHPLGSNIAILPIESGITEYSANERYRFGFTIFGNEDNNPQKIADGLRLEGRAPYSTSVFPKFEVVYVNEVPCTPFKHDPLLAQYDIRLVTPLRMERKEPLPGKRFFDPAFFDGSRFLRLLHSRIYDTAKLCCNDLPPYNPPDVPEVVVDNMELLWVDAPYHNDTKTCGGITGLLKLTARLDECWQKIFFLGQITHAGRNASLGFGNYECMQLPILRHTEPARSWLDRMIAPSNLSDVYNHIKLNGEKTGSGDMPRGCCENTFDVNIGELHDSVKSNVYKSKPLYGVVIPKPGGKTCRTLAIPCNADRVLQRAMCRILGPSIDMLLEENSFAYRKGFSRISAAHAIDRARREGYQYVLRSDINAFFDTVSWNKLERKLNALFREKKLVELLMSWVRQDVVFNGRTIKRSCGLPQGAAISPLLANLYLDEFDDALGDDFKLIRYADDFVVLCRSEETAKMTLERAREALKPLSLEIKPEKTEIVDFEHGFQCLGYLFCRSLTKEVRANE